jgi:hypothetical protein
MITEAHNPKPPPSDPLKIFTKPDVARLLGISIRTLESEISQRKIGYRRIRGSIRFTAFDIEHYLEACRIEPYRKPATRPRRARPKIDQDPAHGTRHAIARTQPPKTAVPRTDPKILPGGASAAPALC